MWTRWRRVESLSVESHADTGDVFTSRWTERTNADPFQDVWSISRRR